MPSFPKPTLSHTVDLAKEIQALRTYRDSKPDLKIPAPTTKTLRIATWNIANLGEQDRKISHLKIIAEMISWFDIVAVQECKENLEDFIKIVGFAGTKYKYIFCDASGNNERMAFIYNSSKVKMLEEIGEYAIPPSDYGDIKITDVVATFGGFDRSPFLVSFAAGKFQFTLMTVHLYFGDESDNKSLGRRCLEVYAVARWADLRSKSKYTFNGIKDVFALGDFNLPKIDKDDIIYKALVKRGLNCPSILRWFILISIMIRLMTRSHFCPGQKQELNHMGYSLLIMRHLQRYTTPIPLQYSKGTLNTIFLIIGRCGWNLI